MQVPQWVVHIPIGQRVDLGLRAMSLKCGHDSDTSYGPKFLA